MFGSIFYNCWAALFAFSVYFFMALNKPVLPSRILLGAFVSALIVFLVTFAIRFLIAFILYTPEDLDDVQEHGGNKEQFVENDQLVKREQEKQSTEEFSDETTEEVAQVVKTLLHTE